MTTMIRLMSMFKRENVYVFREIVINAAHIIQCFVIDEMTAVHLSDGGRIFVKETPDEIYEAIYREEHPLYNRMAEKKE